MDYEPAIGLVSYGLPSARFEIPMKTTRYFEEQVLRKRAYLQREWCERVLNAPIHREIQPDGRVRYWGTIDEMQGRVLRIVTLEDGETVHNAFPDRNFDLLKFQGNRSR